MTSTGLLHDTLLTQVMHLGPKKREESLRQQYALWSPQATERSRPPVSKRLCSVDLTSNERAHTEYDDYPHLFSQHSDYAAKCLNTPKNKTSMMTDR